MLLHVDLQDFFTSSIQLITRLTSSTASWIFDGASEEARDNYTKK